MIPVIAGDILTINPSITNQSEYLFQEYIFNFYSQTLVGPSYITVKSLI